MLSAHELKAKIKEMGADLVGVVSPDNKGLKQHGEAPDRLLPEVGSLISVGVSLNRPAVCSENLVLNRYDSMCVYDRLNDICMDTVRLLAQYGAKTVSIPPYLPVNMGPGVGGMKGEVNHKTVAILGGLGSIGLNRLLVTPEFGPFLRLGTVVTEACFDADPSCEENPCDNCRACLEACPVDAIEEDGTLNYRACMGRVLKSGLSGVINSAKQLTSGDENEANKVLYGPEFWDIWQAMTTGIFYNCSACMAACPVGT